MDVPSPEPGTPTSQSLDTLSLGAFGGFEWIQALRRGLDFRFCMRGKITPPKSPFGRWVSIDLTILPIVMFSDIPASLTGVNHGFTGSTNKATACFLHEGTLRTGFNGDTFHGESHPSPVT